MRPACHLINKYLLYVSGCRCSRDVYILVALDLKKKLCFCFQTYLCGVPQRHSTRLPTEKRSSRSELGLRYINNVSLSSSRTKYLPFVLDHDTTVPDCPLRSVLEIKSWMRTGECVEIIRERRRGWNVKF